MKSLHWESMATYVIQAPGTEEFADGLRMEVLEAADVLGAAAPILGSISNPLGGAGWSRVGCGNHKDLISDQIPTRFFPRSVGIKLQLLCGVRIEPA